MNQRNALHFASRFAKTSEVVAFALQGRLRSIQDSWHGTFSRTAVVTEQLCTF